MNGNTEKQKGNRPSFNSSEYGIAIWINESKDGKKYATVNIPLLGLRNVACFAPQVTSLEKAKDIIAQKDEQPTVTEETLE